MNMQNIRPSKYLRYLVLPTLFGTQRTKEILVVNPTAAPEREEAQEVAVSVFDYNAETLEEKKSDSVSDALRHKQNSHIPAGSILMVCARQMLKLFAIILGFTRC